MIHTRISQWARVGAVAGMGLMVVLVLPLDGRADVTISGQAGPHLEQKQDIASQTFRVLLHEHKELNLSVEQVGQIRTMAADYAKARIRNRAAVDLAEVDVTSLVTNQQSDLAAIEVALHTFERAKAIERLDRVKAIRTVLAALTPEQRGAWDAKMRDRHHDRHRGPSCENVTGRHQPVVNQDESVEMRELQKAGHPSDDEPREMAGVGTTVTSTDLQE